MCVINRECKIKPIPQDEQKRLARLKGNQISLLAKYGYTEKMAYDMCANFGLLSPIYEVGTRGGCWFCMNGKLPQYINIRTKHPKMWEQLRELSKHQTFVLMDSSTARHYNKSSEKWINTNTNLNTN